MTSSLPARILALSDAEMGITACGSYGEERRKQFCADIREMAYQLQKAELMAAKLPINLRSKPLTPSPDSLP